jgi:hypothetical protein
VFCSVERVVSVGAGYVAHGAENALRKTLFATERWLFISLKDFIYTTELYTQFTTTSGES